MKPNILVVDDELSIRESLCKVLQAENYAVVCAEDGQKAIEKFGQEKIDLLLLDLGLPIKDGWDGLEWLGVINRLVPVIIITGRCNQRDLAEMAGADALMEKPLDVPKLLETVHELISEPMERRFQRAVERPNGFRYVSCDSELLREMLLERLTTPYPCNEFNPS